MSSIGMEEGEGSAGTPPPEREEGEIEVLSSQGSVVSDRSLGEVSSQELERGYEHMNPVLVRDVAQRILAAMDVKNLRRARLVCQEWYKLATDEFLTREDVRVNTDVEEREPVPAGQEEEEEEDPIDRFINVMTPSQRIPVTRHTLIIDLLYVSVHHLLKYLQFIAPSTTSLAVLFGAEPRDERSLKEEEVARARELVSQLRKLDENALRMPNLVEFSLCYKDGAVSLSPFRDAVILLIPKMLKGSENLKYFDFSYFYHDKPRYNLPDERIIHESLAKGLKTLNFGRYVFNSAPSYDVFMNCGFQLEELYDDRAREWNNHEDVVKFLSQQQPSLQRLTLSGLEELYREFYSSFRNLKFLKCIKLNCEATCTSTFDFLQSFPNLEQLTLDLGCDGRKRKKKGAEEKKKQKLQNNTQNLPQYPTVRGLLVRACVCANPTHLRNFNLQTISHYFPNITRFSFSAKPEVMLLKLTHLFTYLPNLEWLHLKFFPGQSSSDEVESVISGIPSHVCKLMKASYNFEDSVFGNGYAKKSCRVGMTNLKKLKSLELRADTEGYDQIFTKLTFHRVFMKMESLKSICFICEKEIPKACQPFMKPLRAKGIELYRMNCAFS